MRLFPLALIAACDAVPDDASVRAGPPPASVTLEVGPAVGGMPSPLTVRVPGVGAGYRVFVARADDARSGASCFEGRCFRLIDADEVSRGVTDTNGEAHLRWTPEWSGRSSGVLQAMALGPGDGVVLSSTRSVSVPRSPDDVDADGLPGAWESDRGIDPTARDSDRGGVSDVQEALVDGTDPTDPADDLPGERLCFNDLDDDGDDLEDYEDPDCGSSLYGQEYGCDDAWDDDEDGLLDCADPDCALTTACGEAACTDGADDDADGLTDCADPDCATPACQAEVVWWIDSGEVTLRNRPGLYTQWSSPTYLYGGVWVDGPWGPAVCRWTATTEDSQRLSVGVHPGCNLTAGLLPELDTLTFSTTLGLVDDQGAVFLGPFVLLSLSVHGDRWQYEVPAPLPPLGACAGGAAPTAAFIDADGDGFGADPVDLFGRSQAPVWVCDPTFSGVAAVAGDCNDADPTWTPTTVAVAAGATCADLRWDDEDGDGSPAATDADDRDGAIP
jgi:hypothetical protein